MDNTYIQCVHNLQRIYYTLIYGEIKEFQKCRECMHGIHWKQEIHVSWWGFYFSYLHGYINICLVCAGPKYTLYFLLWNDPTCLKATALIPQYTEQQKGLRASWKDQYQSHLSVRPAHTVTAPDHAVRTLQQAHMFSPCFPFCRQATICT